MRRIDRTGHIYGRLTVIGPAPTQKGAAFWQCKCACGAEVVVRAAHLSRGATKSCGCLQRESARQRAKANEIGGYKGYVKYKTVSDVLQNTIRVGTCMEWQGPTFPNGYAKVGRTERFDTPLLHRWVFAQVNGYYPPVVMHSCDNRRCINPEHLMAGDTNLNTQDKVRKNRQARGSTHGAAILDAKAVMRVMRLRNKGWSQQRIADDVGVTRENIREVLAGRTWKHLRHHYTKE